MFDADAVFSRFVIARLVGQDHAGLQGLVASPEGGDALRPFVNAEKASHAMSRAMRIIEACRPKILACQHIKLRPSRAFWKLRSGKGDVALANKRSGEHTSELQSQMRTSYAGICLK